AQREDHDGGEDAQHDDHDEEFDQGEALLGGLLVGTATLNLAIALKQVVKHCGVPPFSGETPCLGAPFFMVKGGRGGRLGFPACPCRTTPVSISTRKVYGLTKFSHFWAKSHEPVVAAL